MNRVGVLGLGLLLGRIATLFKFLELARKFRRINSDMICRLLVHTAVSKIFLNRPI